MFDFISKDEKSWRTISLPMAKNRTSTHLDQNSSVILQLQSLQSLQTNHHEQNPTFKNHTTPSHPQRKPNITTHTTPRLLSTSESPFPNEPQIPQNILNRRRTSPPRNNIPTPIRRKNLPGIQRIRPPVISSTSIPNNPRRVLDF